LKQACPEPGDGLVVVCHEDVTPVGTHPPASMLRSD
jgi:hypothetical protein